MVSILRRVAAPILITILLSRVSGSAICAEAVLAGTEPVELAIQWIEHPESLDPKIRREIERIRQEFVVIFIPGVLGSKLWYGDDESKAIYGGGDGVVDARLLALREGSRPAHAKVLMNYPAFWTSQDVYASSLDNIGLGLQMPIVQYGYDWRFDIDKLSDEFQSFAESDPRVKGKKVIIIAHSMGGLLAWTWKNKYPPDMKNPAVRQSTADTLRNKEGKRGRPFELVALIIAGSPLAGSCEIANMLINGYGPSKGSSLVERLGLGILFFKARAAAFTFPSVFELLPLGKTCLTVDGYAVDLHDINVWEQSRYSASRKFAHDTDLGEDAYRKQLERAIATGRAFRVNFDARPGTDKIVVYWSGDFKMASSYQATIDKASRWLRARDGPNEDYGDGRVLRENARPQDAGVYPSSRIGGEHGGLLQDPWFIDYMHKDFSQFLARYQATTLAAFVFGDAALRIKAVTPGLLVSPGDVPMSSTGKFSGNQIVLATYNAQQLPNATGNPISDLQTYLRPLSTVSYLSAFKTYADELSHPTVATDVMTRGDAAAEVRTFATRTPTDVRRVLVESLHVLAPDKIEPRDVTYLASVASVERRTLDASYLARSAATMLTKNAKESESAGLTYDVATARTHGDAWKDLSTIFLMTGEFTFAKRSQYNGDLLTNSEVTKYTVNFPAKCQPWSPICIGQLVPD